MSDSWAGGAAEKRAPLEQPYTLPGGRKIRFVMPDLIALADGQIPIPTRLQADMYDLIYGTGGYQQTTAERVNSYQQRTRGLLALFALVAVDADGAAVLSLDDDDRAPTQLAPREIPWGDLESAYYFFRNGPPFIAPLAEDTRQGDGAELVQPGDAVPQGAE